MVQLYVHLRAHKRAYSNLQQLELRQQRRCPQTLPCEHRLSAEQRVGLLADGAHRRQQGQHHRRRHSLMLAMVMLPELPVVLMRLQAVCQRLISSKASHSSSTPCSKDNLIRSNLRSRTAQQVQFMSARQSL